MNLDACFVHHLLCGLIQAYSFVSVTICIELLLNMYVLNKYKNEDVTFQVLAASVDDFHRLKFHQVYAMNHPYGEDQVSCKILTVSFIILTQLLLSM